MGCSGRRAPGRSRSTSADGHRRPASTTRRQEGRRVLGRPGHQRGASPSTRTSPTSGTRAWPTASTPPGSSPPGARSSCRASPEDHLGQVAGCRRCRSGRRDARCRATGEARRRRSSSEQEPDRRRQVRRVPQHRPGVHEEVRDRAVPLPGDEGPARRTRRSSARSRSSTVASR